MDKDKSLKFLQDCIDNINNLTDEEVISLKEKYELNYNDGMINSGFEFIPPSNS